MINCQNEIDGNDIYVGGGFKMEVTKFSEIRAIWTTGTTIKAFMIDPILRPKNYNKRNFFTDEIALL